MFPLASWSKQCGKVGLRVCGDGPQAWFHHREETNGSMMIVWKPPSRLSALSGTVFCTLVTKSSGVRGVCFRTGYLTREQQPQLPTPPGWEGGFSAILHCLLFSFLCCNIGGKNLGRRQRPPCLVWGVTVKLVHIVVAARGFAVGKHCVLSLAWQPRYRTR